MNDYLGKIQQVNEVVKIEHSNWFPVTPFLKNESKKIARR